MELSKQQDTYMDIQKRRTFIISFIYFGIIGVLCYIGLKKLLPILIPFMAAMAIAAMLEPAVSLLDRHMKGGKGAAAAVVLLVFYGSILTIMCVSGSQILSSIQEQAKKLPGIYSQTIEPGLSHFFSLLENSFPGHSIHISALGQSLERFMENASVGISSGLLGWGASAISGIPALVLDFIIAVIASFFLTGNYRETLDFLLYQIPEDRRQMLLQVLLQIRKVACRLLRAYALLMLLTFTELYIGFLVLGIPAGFTLACITSLVDILPVLGTGTVLLPWAFIAWTTGSGSLAMGLVCLYLLIAVVRQTLEPKIIGHQMGLSPIATLLCIFAGGKLLGLTGIFLFPIAATVLAELHSGNNLPAQNQV